MHVLPWLFLLTILVSCSKQEKKETETRQVIVNDTIPYNRTYVRSEPVSIYYTDVSDEHNHFEFAVRLYETPLRFRYKVKVQYKNLTVRDSVDVPNIGIQPKIEVKKYKNDRSCMIGFYDAKGDFKDLKKVEIIDNALKIVQVQRYGRGTVKKQP